MGLDERTGLFAESVIDLVKKIPHNSINKRLIEQIVASSGSIGANYMEASEAESKSDFIHKMKISRKEIKETMHWLRLILKANDHVRDQIKPIYQENGELLLIFSKIIINCSKK